jgi:hypothetical protein
LLHSYWIGTPSHCQNSPRVEWGTVAPSAGMSR